MQATHVRRNDPSFRTRRRSTRHSRSYDPSSIPSSTRPPTAVGITSAAAGRHEGWRYKVRGLAAVRAKRVSPTPRTVWAPLAEIRLERFVCDFRVGRHPRESLRAVRMLAREREPLRGVRIGGDCVGAVTYLHGVAVGTDRIGLMPGADA